jgi:hypothetical protein
MKPLSSLLNALKALLPQRLTQSACSVMEVLPRTPPRWPPMEKPVQVNRGRTTGAWRTGRLRAGRSAVAASEVASARALEPMRRRFKVGLPE